MGHQVHGERKLAGLLLAAKPAEQAGHPATQATPSEIRLGLLCSLKPLLCAPPAVVAQLFTRHEREASSIPCVHPPGPWVGCVCGNTQLFDPLHIKALSQTITAIDRLPTPKHSAETPRQTLSNCQVLEDDKNSLETPPSYCKTLTSLSSAATMKIRAGQSAFPGSHDCGPGVWE